MITDEKLDEWITKFKCLSGINPELAALIKIMIMCDTYITCDKNTCKECDLLRAIKEIAEGALK
jgi:hypothetical protein